MDVASEQQESYKENGNKKEHFETGKTSRNDEEMDFILRPREMEGGSETFC